MSHDYTQKQKSHVALPYGIVSIKRRARELKKESPSPLSSCLNCAAQEVGYKSYQQAYNELVHKSSQYLGGDTHGNNKKV